MSIPYFAARTASLPYRQPGHLPNRPRYVTSSPSPNLQPRDLGMLPRTIQGDDLPGGYIALIIIAVLVVVTSITALAVFLYRRNTPSSKASTPYSSRQVLEKQRIQTWQRLSSGWAGKRSFNEDTQSLISHHSRMPSITISRPIAHTADSGITSIFGVQDHRYTGVTDLSQPSPEAVYDPHTRAHSRSRSHSKSNSVQSSARSRNTSPNVYTSRSRDSSVSSQHSRSHSNSRSSRPLLGQNSWSQTRARSLSNSSLSKRSLSQSSPPLPETSEEHISSTESSPREKSLPPPPPKSFTSPNKNSLTYTPADLKNWHIDPYTNFSQQKSSLRFAGSDGLQVDDTQVISIAIAAPLDIPEGPLTPFGEREAKAGAALGMKSTWYKSPRNDSGSWLV